MNNLANTWRLRAENAAEDAGRELTNAEHAKDLATRVACYANVNRLRAEYKTWTQAANELEGVAR